MWLRVSEGAGGGGLVVWRLMAFAMAWGHRMGVYSVVHGCSAWVLGEERGKEGVAGEDGGSWDRVCTVLYMLRKYCTYGRSWFAVVAGFLPGVGAEGWRLD